MEQGSRRDFSYRPGPGARPTTYALMVAGARTGKTSFLRLLLDTSLFSSTAQKDQVASVAKFVQGCAGRTTHIRTASVDIELEPLGAGPRGTCLVLVDTPTLDFGDEEEAERTVHELLKYAESRFEEGDPENGDHVHLCLYFLDPDNIVPPVVPGPVAPVVQRMQRNGSFSHSGEPFILEPPVATKPSPPNLPSAEITTIRRLSHRLNVLPVIARADTLSNDRLSAVKLAVRKDLADAGIGFGIFDHAPESQFQSLQLPPMNGDRDATSNGRPPSESSHPSAATSTLHTPPTSPVVPLMLRLPYALISPDMYSHSDGVTRVSPSRHELVAQYTPSCRNVAPIVKGHFIRQYRWGTLDVLDPAHSDFLALRNAIFHHMEALQNYTKDYLCKKYLAENPAQYPHSFASHPIAPTPTRLPHSRPILAIDTNAVPGHSLQHSQGAPTANGLSPSTHVPETKSASSSRTKLPGQRTKKITVACNFCRSRKLRCDGGRPACAQCQKRSHHCDYQKDRRRRGTRGVTKKEDDSELSIDESPDAGDELEQSLSPEVQSLPPLSLDGNRHPQLPPIAHYRRPSGGSSPLPPPPSVYPHSDPPPTGRSDYPLRYDDRQDLPHIAAIVTTVPSTVQHLPPPPPMSAPSHNPREAELQSSPVMQRKRSATTPNGKGIRSISSSGPKVVACNHCRNRKTKCDGAHPACSSCVRRSVPCQYATESTARKPRKPSTRKQDGASVGGEAPPVPTPLPQNIYNNLNGQDGADNSPPLKKMKIDLAPLASSGPS